MIRGRDYASGDGAGCGVSARLAVVTVWWDIYIVVCDCMPARDWGLKYVGVGGGAHSSCMACLLSVTRAPEYMVINPCF